MSRAHTQEQERAAAAIVALAEFNLYDVLDVSPNANLMEISKAYKKQALKLHPDKNSAPSAQAAMRAVNSSFETLSDPIKREWFDTHGTSLSQSSSSTTESRTNPQSDIKDIDKMFTDFISNVSREIHKTHTQQHLSNRMNFMVLLCGVLIFAVIVILLGLNPQLASSRRSQRFSFTPSTHTLTGDEMVRHYTYGPRISFYTDKNFGENAYPLDSPQRKRVESQIEDTMKQLLLKQCAEKRVTIEQEREVNVGTMAQPEACVQLELLFSK